MATAVEEVMLPMWSRFCGASARTVMTERGTTTVEDSPEAEVSMHGEEKPFMPGDFLAVALALAVVAGAFVRGVPRGLPWTPAERFPLAGLCSDRRGRDRERRFLPCSDFSCRLAAILRASELSGDCNLETSAMRRLFSILASRSASSKLMKHSLETRLAFSTVGRPLQYCSDITGNSRVYLPRN